MENAGTHKIKVCHVTSVHGRYDGRIFRKECVSLAQAGYEVHLVVADAEGDEERDGVHIWHIPCKAKNRLQRMTKVAGTVCHKALELKADIYHLHDPELLRHALKLKRHGAKVIFDSHEDVFSIIIEKKYLPWGIRRVVQWLANRYQISRFRRLDALISVTPHICTKLGRYNANVSMCTNYPLLMPGVTHGNSRNLVYAGGISKQWNHEQILDAIKKLNCRYFLAGKMEKGYLPFLECKSAWPKVSYYEELLSFEQVQNLYAQSNVGIALLSPGKNTNGRKGTLGNTKLFEFMMAGLPVVCTDFVLWKDIVEKEHCGICVSPTDTEAITDAIRYLLEHPDEARQMGENGRKAAEREYNWKSQERILLELYRRLGGMIL